MDATRTATATLPDRESGNRSAVEEFIQAATVLPKQLNKKQVSELRNKAIAELRAKYGSFTEEVIDSLVDNPAVQIMVAGQVSGESWQKHVDMDILRNKRRQGIYLLVERFGWPEKDVQDALQLEKKQARIVPHAVRVVDPELPLPRWSAKTAEKNMVESHKEFERRVRVGKYGRKVRDELIHTMTRGQAADRRMWTNAQLARLAGESTAHVAIIRNGTANPKTKKSQETS